MRWPKISADEAIVAMIAEHERLAEAAYDAMYDARPNAVKDHYETALMHLRLAIVAARESGNAAQAERLINRAEDIEAIYNSQFRYAGR